MKDQKLYSREILPLPLTVEYHLASHSHRSHAIYLILVLSLIALVALLPFLLINVTVKSPGILRPATEMNQLKATSAGIVKQVLVKENAEVKKGQLLFEVRLPILEEKESYLNNKVKEIKRFQQDLDRLTDPNRSDPNEVSGLLTPLYRQSLMDYRQKLMDRKIRLYKVKQDYDRNKRLYDERVIAKAELENYEFELEKSKADLDLLKHSQLSVWQQELTSHEKDAAYYQDQLAQTQREKENLNILAPVSGSIQNLAGIYEGSPVFPNQDLAQITPNSDLVAEVYVSPIDIGLLHEGMDVRMQISAFDYNQWGLVQGKVKDISKDIQQRNNKSVFEIKCSLSTDHMSLKNGYQGKLKKGMTLQARFSIVERSLWQLLYDRLDDWMNPDLRH